MGCWGGCERCEGVGRDDKEEEEGKKAWWSSVDEEGVVGLGVSGTQYCKLNRQIHVYTHTV